MDDALPICFDLPANPQAPTRATGGKHQLHGADDLISIFDLKPLYAQSVKPFTAASRAKQKEQANVVKEEISKEAESNRANEQGGDADHNSSRPAGDAFKPLIMEKTYVNYVKDLPGQVKPPRRTVSKYNSALAAASASGAPMPVLPPEITGRTTMREIVFRPETTMQRIAPFDEESLRSAFTVEAGPVDDIDLGLLDSDEIEKQSPTKRKKKRKHQRDNTGDRGQEGSAKRSKLNMAFP